MLRGKVSLVREMTASLSQNAHKYYGQTKNELQTLNSSHLACGLSRISYYMMIIVNIVLVFTYSRDLLFVQKKISES